MRFREAKPTTRNYVYITSHDGGCYSHVGYQKIGAQQLNLEHAHLNDGCWRTGHIIHEILHSLGFYHEQSTFNRDNYVNILMGNVETSRKDHFIKYNSAVVTDFGVGYDYGSILHYGPYTFSKNGLPTIIRRIDDGTVMGQRRQMSVKDIKKLNRMYRCFDYKINKL